MTECAATCLPNGGAGKKLGSTYELGRLWDFLRGFSSHLES